jgi:ATP synthase protein I
MVQNGSENEKLNSLDDRIRAARNRGPDGRAKERAEQQERSRADGIAWRVSAELVASFLVCGFIGWWLDEWFGSRPWVFIGGLLLGGAVGIRNVYAVAMRVQREAEKAASDGTDG